MKTPPVSSSSATSDPPRAAAGARGRYLPRHRARIVERDNLLLVEFLEPPTASVGALLRRRPLPAVNLPAWHIVLLWGVSLSALTLELLRLLL